MKRKTDKAVISSRWPFVKVAAATSDAKFDFTLEPNAFERLTPLIPISACVIPAPSDTRADTFSICPHSFSPPHLALIRVMPTPANPPPPRNTARALG